MFVAEELEKLGITDEMVRDRKVYFMFKMMDQKDLFSALCVGFKHGMGDVSFCASKVECEDAKTYKDKYLNLPPDFVHDLRLADYVVNIICQEVYEGFLEITDSDGGLPSIFEHKSLGIFGTVDEGVEVLLKYHPDLSLMKDGRCFRVLLKTFFLGENGNLEESYLKPVIIKDISQNGTMFMENVHVVQEDRKWRDEYIASHLIRYIHPVERVVK